MLKIQAVHGEQIVQKQNMIVKEKKFSKKLITHFIFAYKWYILKTEFSRNQNCKIEVKGGDMMSLESIRIVTEAETKAKEQLEDARTQARTIVNQATAKGKELTEHYRQMALAENKRLWENAEKQAEADKQAVLQKTASDCESLELKAKSRLETAAGLIVERIVNG